MINEDSENLIKFFESCSLTAYQCPANIWTIGWGSTKYSNGTKVKKGDKITQQQADELFDVMIKEFEAGVKKLVKVKINENQLGALVSFAYNCGLGNLASSTLLKKINASDFDGADNEFKKWNKGGGKVLPGLVKRRLQEAALFNK
jgi:lysozyme